MATHEIRIDRGLPLAAEPHTGHNRWHPGIPPVLTCDPGDEVILDTRDTFDGFFDAGSTSKDVAAADFGLVHPLTGPVAVSGAQPGDLLVAEILEVIPQPFGFTAQVPGFGFLRDDFPDANLVRWHLSDGWATSDDVPGVRIAGAPFMGVIGVAPSEDLLRSAAAREADLAARNPTDPVLLPDPAGAVPDDEIVAGEGLRTIPPREHGGNVDIKQLTAGTRVLLPVWVEGALFSAGDAHFAQGDGESCGTAIEMAATLRVRLDLLQGQAAERGIRTLCFERDGPGPVEPPRRYFATTGICVGRDGRNEFEDLTLAARNALDAMIVHLVHEYGYTRPQAYTICSVAVDLKISQAVDVPNVIVSAFLPLEIFV
ncbi:MAG TPA: acetamidase/formamidase family protein [Acidimicrobiia bacterium]|nr:acetamidase/formamidase family protein [Acidimicrobiia bacterium]